MWIFSIYPCRPAFELSVPFSVPQESATAGLPWLLGRRLEGWSRKEGVSALLFPPCLAGLSLAVVSRFLYRKPQLLSSGLCSLQL